jgi:uncharacterized protein
MNSHTAKKINVLIFAKAPIAGFAKTRLIPELGAEGAASLAKRLLCYTLDNAITADIGTVTLCATPDIDHPVWQTLNLPKAVCWANQGEGDLGARLARIAQEYIAKGEAVIFIGTDCPTLDANKLRNAANSLSRLDAFIIPATDGGYTLLGLTKFHPSLFENISWSTSSVLTQTLSRIQQLQWTYEIDTPLHDIDEPEDLQWLPSQLTTLFDT